jgi:hypothetical protein
MKTRNSRLFSIKTLYTPIGAAECKNSLANQDEGRIFLAEDTKNFVSIPFHSGLMDNPADRLRHSVYFGIIDSEWPAVKAGLQKKLGPP